MMKRFLTLLLTLTLYTTSLTLPALAFPQGESGSRNQQGREVPTGKIVDRYRRSQPGARPAWVTSALERSLAHLRNEGAAHGINDADAELSLLSAVYDELGQTHVRLEQIHRGVPVLGGQLVTHLDAPDPKRPAGGTRTYTNGRIFAEARRVSTRARLTPAAALAAAKQSLKRDAGFEREKVELVVLPEAVRRGGDGGSGATLTYKVELLVNDGREAARHFYFINARDGGVVWNYDNLKTGIGHGLYSGTGYIATVSTSFMHMLRDPSRTNSSLCGAPGIITSDFLNSGPCYPLLDGDNMWGNSEPFNLETSAVDAHRFAAITFDYYLNRHGRNSLDGAGQQMCNRMRSNGAGINNAFWDGQCTNYGQGSQGRHFASVDVVGHEYTHGVTDHVVEGGDLAYQNESGGADESFSDIFGTMIEFYSGRNPDYLIGEDINGAFRNMANPRSDGVSIDHYDLYFDGMDVHHSSGLQNVAFYLLAESGTHPWSGVFVKKIGRDRAAAIYYRALETHVTPTAKFNDIREACEKAASDLYGTGNPIYNAVRRSWYSSGVGPDVPFNPIDTTTDFVAQHYRDFFLREPDAGGLNHWSVQIDQCGSDAACEAAMRVNVSRSMWDSVEFQSRADVQSSGLLTGNSAHPYDNHQFIRWCYLNYLRREPDAAGWSSWEAYLNNHGGDYNAIIRGFLTTPEYRERFGSA